ncbi:hypothetical protein [Rhizobium mongolense]|uniref:Uncharacterized protein n=2 Tax=Rhizobium mongolense TaxID=57676 RepID=A0ABR6IZI8_9HYPH|nr:hypothetical protein [Rhizobium mongolense]MBB4233334.1 hypothetical protein [Rhizobium mongolense]TVZ74759.1 hypothetical protein BCL32_0065 [Rhizobium mongolense USDA 1844]
MLGYYLGCAALGITTGLLVGMSSSPVVQYVLPLLFALIGGSAGLFAIKASNTASASEAKLAIAGWTSVCLTIPFLISMLYGTLVRTGSDIHSLLPSVTSQPAETTLSADALAGLTADDTVAILLASRGLTNAGVADADRKAVVDKIIASRMADEKKFTEVSGNLAQVSREAVARFEQIASSQNDIVNNSTFVSAWQELASLDKTFSNAAIERQAKYDVSRKVEEKLASDFSADFTRYLKSDPTLAGQISESIVLIRSLPAPDVLASTTRADLYALPRAPNEQALSRRLLPSVAIQNPPLTVPDPLFQRRFDNPT